MTLSSFIIGNMLDGKLNETEMVDRFGDFDLSSLTPEALAEAAKELQKRMVKIDLPGEPVDTCGTGGSGKERINTSTIVAFLVATAGAKVAKHGNKSAGGRCGSFDLLEGLGAKIELTPEQEKIVYETLGIVFLFARAHHPAMKHVAAARKTYGKPTIFNLLGPLCNPAGSVRPLTGVSGVYNIRLIADAQKILGRKYGYIVQGTDGLDEITLNGETKIIDLTTGVEERRNPEDFGMQRRSEAELRGGDASENIRLTLQIASGKGSLAHQDLVCLNAAYALTLAGISKNPQEGLAVARELLSSGKVQKMIDAYVSLTSKLS